MAVILTDPTSYMPNEDYWLDLLSMAEHALAQSGDFDASGVIARSTMEMNGPEVEEGPDSSLYFAWKMVLRLQLDDYLSASKEKEHLESKILACLDGLHHDERNALYAVSIEPIVKRILRWDAILPVTKDDAIALIQKEREVLIATATGTSYKTPGIQEEYAERHQQIATIAQKVGFDYPVTDATLPCWWQTIRAVESYAERRAYIDRLFEPLLAQLEDDSARDLKLSGHATGRASVEAALRDARVLVVSGKFTSAVDRMHTAFHGYLRELLDVHQVPYAQSDSLPALLAKLHDYYGQEIRPPQVASRVRTILRSCGGAVGAINEIRNNNTYAHPTEQLIKDREAKLVIRTVDTLMSFIEDVESEIQ